MTDKTQNFEKEYSYSILKENIDQTLPKKYEGFELCKQYDIELEDLLFERERISLKSEKIGVRVRKSDNKIEFTYKKFLERRNGAAIYDEINHSITQQQFDALKNCVFTDSEIFKLSELQKVGKLFILMRIVNFRNVYLYKNDSAEIELVIERIKYFAQDKSVEDYMLEIEFKANDDSPNVLAFVEYFKQLFNGIELDEGKNTRGMRLLGLSV